MRTNWMREPIAKYKQHLHTLSNTSFHFRFRFHIKTHDITFYYYFVVWKTVYRYFIKTREATFFCWCCDGLRVNIMRLTSLPIVCTASKIHKPWPLPWMLVKLLFCNILCQVAKQWTVPKKTEILSHIRTHSGAFRRFVAFLLLCLLFLHIFIGSYFSWIYLNPFNFLTAYEWHAQCAEIRSRWKHTTTYTRNPTTFSIQ